MRLLDISFALAVAGAIWLRWESPRSIDVKTSYYWTRADTVVCETPFQIRKAIVATARDDGARIRSLSCSRPGGRQESARCFHASNCIRTLGNSIDFGATRHRPDVELC
jgi:hypothetical protein